MFARCSILPVLFAASSLLAALPAAAAPSASQPDFDGERRLEFSLMDLAGAVGPAAAPELLGGPRTCEAPASDRTGRSVREVEGSRDVVKGPRFGGRGPLGSRLRRRNPINLVELDRRTATST